MESLEDCCAVFAAYFVKNSQHEAKLQNIIFPTEFFIRPARENNSSHSCVGTKQEAQRATPLDLASKRQTKQHVQAMKNISTTFQATSQFSSSLLKTVGTGMRSAGDALANVKQSTLTQLGASDGEAIHNPEIAELYQVLIVKHPKSPPSLIKLVR